MGRFAGKGWEGGREEGGMREPWHTGLQAGPPPAQVAPKGDTPQVLGRLTSNQAAVQPQTADLHLEPASRRLVVSPNFELLLYPKGAPPEGPLGNTPSPTCPY